MCSVLWKTHEHEAHIFIQEFKNNQNNLFIDTNDES